MSPAWGAARRLGLQQPQAQLQAVGAGKGLRPAGRLTKSPLTPLSQYRRLRLRLGRRVQQWPLPAAVPALGTEPLRAGATEAGGGPSRERPRVGAELCHRRASRARGERGGERPSRRRHRSPQPVRPAVPRQGAAASARQAQAVSTPAAPTVRPRPGAWGPDLPRGRPPAGRRPGWCDPATQRGPSHVKNTPKQRSK